MLEKSPTGQGRKRDTSKPKGRQLDDSALADVRELLGGKPLRRDLLIEHLHLIQDKFGCLQAKHIRALAEEMRLAQVEVYEVASFYDHFDVVKEGEPVPAPLTIRVCDSVSCMMAGAEQLIEQLHKNVDPAEIRIMRAPCMGGCDVAPAARVVDVVYEDLVRGSDDSMEQVALALGVSLVNHVVMPWTLRKLRLQVGDVVWAQIKSVSLQP